MPKRVTGGQVVWYEEEPGTLIGRAEVFSIPGGLASSFSCGSNCPCPLKYLSDYMSPASVQSLVGDQGQAFIPMLMKSDCNAQAFGPYNETSISTWLSGNTSVATVSSSGVVSCVGAGSTTINATFHITDYADVTPCNARTLTLNPSGGLTVQQYTSVKVLSTSTQGAAVCPAGQAGWSRTVTLQLSDQSGNAIRRAGITMADSIQVPSPNALGITNTRTGSFTTSSSGTWMDTYFVCSSACPASTSEVDAAQYWTYNGLSLPHVNTVAYKCNSIKIDGN